MLEAAIMCLALNIYHEARGESLVGQIAVTEVVLNRVDSPQFPNNVCDVVKQAKYKGTTPIRNQCQFSWWCDGRSDKPTNLEQWDKAVNLANALVHNKHLDITEGALYYHSTAVKPYWASHYKKVTTIDNHIFYK
jgi:N-acetylmuramoyl-L-alanine amidase